MDRPSPARTEMVLTTFVRTADENYLIARWCYKHRLSGEFVWNALHAIEKYLKAARLMNGFDAKFGHDIEKPFVEFRKFVGERLIPDQIVISGASRSIQNGSFEMFDFIRNLESGGASVRYLGNGYVVTYRDLHFLDAVVWRLRRVIAPLDHAIDETQTHTWREWLIENPRSAPPLHTTLEDALSHDSPLRSHVLEGNLAFGPDASSINEGPPYSAGHNPVRFTQLIGQMGHGSRDVAVAALHDAVWWRRNVKMAKDDKEELEKAIHDARQKYQIGEE